jgi:tRNA 2-selenouridine synthase
MRSEIMSWLLSMAGFEIFRLKGGYKTYRTFTYETVRSREILLFWEEKQEWEKQFCS